MRASSDDLSPMGELPIPAKAAGARWRLPAEPNPNPLLPTVNMHRTAAGSCVTRAVLPSPRDTPTVRPATSTAPAAASRAGKAARLVRTAAADKAGGGFDSGGAMWGGRFEEGVSNIVERFGESVSFDKKLYKQVGPHAPSAHAAHSANAHRSPLARRQLPQWSGFAFPNPLRGTSPVIHWPACAPGAWVCRVQPGVDNIPARLAIRFPTPCGFHVASTTERGSHCASTTPRSDRLPNDVETRAAPRVISLAPPALHVQLVMTAGVCTGAGWGRLARRT